MQMIKYSKAKYESVDDAKRIVRENEADFEARLSALTKSVSEETNSRLITLSGPTCSGKTTTANKLVDTFTKCHKRVNIISIDDFYYDNVKLVEISKAKGIDHVDYDSADTIDLRALDLFIDEILDSKKPEVHCPIYDFVEKKRTRYKTLECTDDDIFVFEGIQALYPEVIELFDGRPFSSIFICAKSGLDVEGVVFEPNEIRLLRRLVRDNHRRATSPELTFGMWKNVRNNEDVNIFPYADRCEYQIDSVFPHEISLLKPYLEEILPTVSADSEFYDDAQTILKKIAHIDAIPKEYIAENSLYHEFI